MRCQSVAAETQQASRIMRRRVGVRGGEFVMILGAPVWTRNRVNDGKDARQDQHDDHQRASHIMSIVAKQTA